uniref:MHC class II beta chain N-terminal domain-containing protein n=1 Tax=Chrysemys picta bellii TaxID=8478 RepID=A0A8C3FJB2_CHRPI
PSWAALGVSGGIRPQRPGEPRPACPSHSLLPPAGWFLYQTKSDCLFTNGTERVRFLDRYMYDRQQFVQFDSDVGVYVGETEVGRHWAEYWNKNKEFLAQMRAAVDTFCRHNYGAVEGNRRPRATGGGSRRWGRVTGAGNLPGRPRVWLQRPLAAGSRAHPGQSGGG